MRASFAAVEVLVRELSAAALEGWALEEGNVEVEAGADSDALGCTAGAAPFTTLSYLMTFGAPFVELEAAPFVGAPDCFSMARADWWSTDAKA
jgi:hypothetical protein